MPLLAAAMGLMLARILIAARFLDLSGFAQFSAGLLISSSFCMLGCLGVHAVLQRDMPMFLIRGRERRSAVLLTQAWGLAGILAAVALPTAIGGWNLSNTTTSLTIAGIVHGLTQQWFLLATVESRSRGDPIRFAQQMMARAAIVSAAGLGALAVTASPIVALLVESTMTLAVTTFILSDALRRAALGYLAAARLGWRRIAAIPWPSAIALMSVSLVTFVAQYCDRWIAAAALPESEFALYSFAWTLPLIGQSIQLIVNAAVFPLIARRHGTHGPERSFRISAQLSFLMAITGATLVLPASWLLDLGVRIWLPAYVEATPLITVFLVVTVLRISDFWTTYLTVAGHERALLKLNLLATVSAIAIWAWMRWPNDADVEIRPYDIALLAVMVAAATYVSAALIAWIKYATRRGGSGGGASKGAPS